MQDIIYISMRMLLPRILMIKDIINEALLYKQTVTAKRYF